MTIIDPASAQQLERTIYEQRIENLKKLVDDYKTKLEVVTAELEAIKTSRKLYEDVMIDNTDYLMQLAAERDALRMIVDSTTPIGAFDIATSLRAENALLREQLAALHPLADGYAGAMRDLAEARAEIAELNHAIEIVKAHV